MVINIEPSPYHTSGKGGAKAVRHSSSGPRAAEDNHSLTIGLLNNMAGTAFKSTERQFVSLLDAASDGLPVHVRFYTLPGVSEAESGGAQFTSHYESADALFDTELDGLIVTGREPKKADLRDEPYWHSFTRVLDWARANTRSTVWSCLAAHAAILHLDGIGRRRTDEKQFGVFECMKTHEHPLMRGLGSHFQVPHSRWNGVAQEDLAERGYTVLSQLCGDGVDSFIKQHESLFVFFQGHLEYEPDTLMREYRRDVGRFIKAQTKTYPLLPSGYFDSETEEALTALKEGAAALRGSDLLGKVAHAAGQNVATHTWKPTAARVYSNWLACISDRKEQSRFTYELSVPVSR